MEAIPRLPMLCFETKPFYPKNAQFGPEIMHLIRHHYQEDPNNYIEEIQQFEKLRQQAAKLNKDVEGVATLKRYFCQLYLLQKRFPSLKDISSNSEISWKDLISSSNSKKIDYRSEFATTLYNIGVLHTQLGVADDRTTEEGLKMACTHFQCAAWAFQHLREITSVNARPDFDHGYLEFVISTCLAQAQECIAEKSISDNRKPSTSAKIVTQICEYYQAAKHGLARLVQEDSIFGDSGVKCPQVNLTYLKYKLPYYRSIANLFLGMQAEEDEKMGERVAYFELASEEFLKARQHAAEITEYPLNKGLDEAMSFIHDIVEGKLKNAVSENNFIYHEEVPPKDKLQRVKGASLVKCIGFDFNDMEISGPDIFSKLISMKAHVLSSVYSEEKAKLLRSVSASVEEKETELNSFMQSLKLDYLNTTSDPNSLPEELIERCAACEAKPTIVQDLIGSMSKLTEAHRDVEYMMKEIMALIEEEEKADEEFQIVVSTNRPPTIVSTDLKCEANRYQEALKRATESNESLRDAIAAHVNNIRVLSLPLDQLEEQLPRVSLEYSPEERNIVTELQRLVDKVEEMKNQRAHLMLRLRESLQNDDITEQIVLNDEDKNEFSNMVVKEISKHQEVVNLIEQNLKAQANILKAVTNTYAAYAPIRKIISETAHKRSVQISALIESFDVSDDVLQKTSRGLDFYRRLEVNASKLLSRVKGTCKVQDEERLQMYSKIGKKPPSHRRPFPESNSVNSEKLPSSPAAPKLKDYLGQGRTGKIVTETSLPYNPYYNTAAAAVSVPSYAPPVTTPIMDSKMPSSAYYSTVARPPPLGSENKVSHPNSFEPSVDAKTSAVATPSTITNNAGYSYTYYNSPSVSNNASYQTSVTASRVAPNASNISFDAQSSYAGVAYPANNLYAASATSNIQDYSGAYNVSQTNTPIYPGYIYPNTRTSTSNQPTKAPLSKSDVAARSNYSYTPTGTSYPSTVSGYSYLNASASSDPSSTGYQISNVTTGTNLQHYAGVSAVCTSASSSVAYTTSYGAASITTTATSVMSYTNPATNIPYGGTNATPSALMYPSSNSYLPPTNSQQNAPTDGYNYSYGVTNYLGAATVDLQNSAQQSYNPYQVLPGYGSHNPPLQYSYSSDASYMPQNNVQQQQSMQLPSQQQIQPQRQIQHQQQMQQHQLQNSSLVNQNLTNFASAAGTYSTSCYTNAGYNITPSSTVDGRNYLTIQEQQAVTHSLSGGAGETPVAASDLYYMSPYGYQQCNPQTTDDRNVEQFVSRCDDSTNEQTDRLQAKRNSMTYMQAGGSKHGNTVSTFSAGSSSTTTKNANVAAPAEKKPSNVDLLADLDFNVPDVPLMPSTPAPSCTTATNEITETLSSISLNKTNESEMPDFNGAGKTLQTVFQSNAISQRKQSDAKSTTVNDFTEKPNLEKSVVNSIQEKNISSVEIELMNHPAIKDEISKPNRDRSASNSGTFEVAPSKPIDPLSSIDALWPLKKEQY